jgi:hypothetical protein
VVDGLNGYLLQLEDKESLNLALTKFSGLNRDGYRLLRVNAVQLHRSRFLDSKNYDLIFQLIQTL